MKVFWHLDQPQRRNLLILFASGLLFWTSLASLLPTLPLYIEFVGGTKQQIGVVMGAFAIGLLLCRPRLGQMADRRSRKLVLLIGAVVAAIAPLCYLFVQSIPLLFAIRAFHGISVAAFTTAYSALVVDLSPVNERGELIGYMSLVAPIGVALGPAMGGFLQTTTGYDLLFICSSLLAIISYFGVIQIKEHNNQLIRLKGQAASIAAANQPFWQILAKPGLFVPSLVLSLVGFAFGAVTTFVALYIVETKINLNPGLFYTVAAVASFSSRIFIGRASDIYGRGLFITASIFSYACAVLMLSQANNPIIFLLAAILEGVGVGTLLPMMVALISDRSSAAERGRVFAICISGFDLGVAISAPVFGSLAEAIGYRGIFVVSTAMAILGLIVFITHGSKNLSHSFRFAFGREKDLYALKQIGSSH